MAEGKPMHTQLVDAMEQAFKAENMPSPRYSAQLAVEVIKNNQALVDGYLELLAVLEKKKR